MEKLLAEWFWIDRWMGSSAFLLPMEARGVYREMLTQAWRRDAKLPNNHEAIRRAIGATPKEWSRSWPLIERFWNVEGESLTNQTQQEVYADARARQDKASTRGKAGAQARLERNLRLTQVLAQAPAQVVPMHKPPSPSLSPISDPEKRDLPEDLDEMWMEFQRTYPAKRREGGRIVFDLFLKAVESVGFETLIAALRRHVQSDDWKRGFAPGMEKWFEKTMWIQEPDQPATSADDVPAMAEFLAKIDAEKAARGR